MPKIYLSPSTQEYNDYVTEGNEEYWMNEIADAMIPYLRSSGITVMRNTPQMTAASSITQSNQSNVDLHVALHSNAAPESLAGKLRGSDVYYSPNSSLSKKFAEIEANNLKKIYPDPSLVLTRVATNLGEVTRTNAPSVLIEYAYHDNVDDANWIKNNINEIARNTVESITKYFDIPFINAQAVQTAKVNVESGNLNIRSKPNINANIVGKAPKGADIYVLGKWDNWYVVYYNGVVGYSSADFIKI